MESFNQDSYDHDPSEYDYEFVDQPDGYGVFNRLRQRLNPIRLREKVLDLFRSGRNVEYLQNLFRSKIGPGEARDFIVDAVPDSVLSYERAEEILESDPMAQRGKLKSGATQWDELKRLNTAYFYDRMNIANEFQDRLGHGMAANEPYHYLMFMADSLYPPGMSFLNTNPLYEVEENRFVPDTAAVSADTAEVGRPGNPSSQTPGGPYVVKNPERRLARRVLDYMDRGDASDLGRATGAYRPLDSEKARGRPRRADPADLAKERALAIGRRLNDPSVRANRAGQGRRAPPISSGKEKFASGPFPQSEPGVWTADAVGQRLDRKINVDQDAATRRPPQRWQDNFLVPDRYDGVDFVAEPSDALRHTDSAGRTRYLRPKTGEVYTRRFRRYTGFPRFNWVKRGDEYVERGENLDGMGSEYVAWPKGTDMSMVRGQYGLDGYAMGATAVDGAAGAEWRGSNDNPGTI